MSSREGGLYSDMAWEDFSELMQNYIGSLSHLGWFSYQIALL